MSQATENSNLHADGGDGGTRRACDQCRGRKIRCDKETPCSNCRISQKECSTTGAGQRLKEARQRVLISTQYERKIDQLDDRLASIEQLLRNMTPGDRSSALSTSVLIEPTTPRTFTPSVTGTGVVSSTGLDRSDEEPSTFEGSSSLQAHTAFASDFLEQAVEQTTLLQINRNMQAALASLQQMVKLQDRPSGASEGMFPHQKPLPKGGFKELPMPPSNVVINLLREVKDSSFGSTSMMRCFMAADDFIDYCRRVYFSTEDFTLMTFIIVNGGLLYVLEEKAILTRSERALEELWVYHRICRDNMETALAHVTLILPARKETIEALLVGAFYAVENSRPSVAWHLNSAAANLCLTLGWHRRPNPIDIPDETQNVQATLFWFAYQIDKGLALRLGRASVIQDFDVTLPRTMGGTVDSTETWARIMCLWIRHSQAQGRAYDHLYSPQALAQTEERRVECARVLAEEIKRIDDESAVLRQQAAAVLASVGDIEADEASKAEAQATEMILRADEVGHWSLLTLVYRAIPSTSGFPTTFSAECIEAARATFRMHQECMNLMGTSPHTAATYLSWTILFSPFVAFIVLFCHVIEASHLDDLRRLSEFVTSLEPTREISTAIDRLHKLCHVLYNVAYLYVEAKVERDEDLDMAHGNEFEVYLSALGLMPASEPTAGAALDNNLPDSAVNRTTMLGDWFSGNRHMTGLLEEDLSQFHPMEWGVGS